MIRDFLRHRRGVAGLSVIGLLVLFCYVGPLVQPTDQVQANIAITNMAPGTAIRSEPTPTAMTCWGG